MKEGPKISNPLPPTLHPHGIPQRPSWLVPGFQVWESPPLAITSLDCPPGLAGPDHRPHSQEQRNQRSAKSQSLEGHSAPIPWGASHYPHSSTVVAHHCHGRHLRSKGTGGTVMGLLGPQLTPLLRRPQLRWPQGCCCAASRSPPPSAGTPAPHVPGNPDHISLQEPPPKGTLWGETEHF